jgi:hypothetical protein
VSWNRVVTPDNSSCLVFDGRNPDIPGDQDKFVPHSFMTLELNGPTLTEKVLLSNSAEIFSGTQ